MRAVRPHAGRSPRARRRHKSGRVPERTGLQRIFFRRMQSDRLPPPRTHVPRPRSSQVPLPAAYGFVGLGPPRHHHDPFRRKARHPRVQRAPCTPVAQQLLRIRRLRRLPRRHRLRKRPPRKNDSGRRAHHRTHPVRSRHDGAAHHRLYRDPAAGRRPHAHADGERYRRQIRALRILRGHDRRNRKNGWRLRHKPSAHDSLPVHSGKFQRSPPPPQRPPRRGTRTSGIFRPFRTGQHTRLGILFLRNRRQTRLRRAPDSAAGHMQRIRHRPRHPDSRAHHGGKTRRRSHRRDSRLAQRVLRSQPHFRMSAGQSLCHRPTRPHPGRHIPHRPQLRSQHDIVGPVFQLKMFQPVRRPRRAHPHSRSACSARCRRQRRRHARSTGSFVSDFPRTHRKSRRNPRRHILRHSRNHSLRHSCAR